MKLQAKANTFETRNYVLTKAFINATKQLGLETVEILNISGMSATTWSRVINHERMISVETKEAELVLFFIRIYRSLDALFGGDQRRAQEWLRVNNYHLNGTPIQLLQDIAGLVKVVNYLDAMRGLA